jgi:oxygen-independent coproporphyrinogen-3 oxidase
VAGLYLHIPFCLSKCRYCNFNSHPSPGQKSLERYTAALAVEIDRLADRGRPLIDTVYFGGGTPAILGSDNFCALFSILRSRLTLDRDAEITVEANPGSLDRRQAGDLLSLGVNRVSLGVQSFSDSLLLRLGRGHTAAAAREAFHLLRETGFGNIGLDLIYGLPGQDLADWEASLNRALALRPEHLSLYGLSVEKGTPFAEEKKRGCLDLPTEETVIEMYRLACRLAGEAGYEHYEISNWALPGFQSRHNRNCWTMKENSGTGAGAHSFVRSPVAARYRNIADFAVYTGAIERGESPVAGREDLSPSTVAGEALMLGLRLLEGVDCEHFRRQWGGVPAELFPEGVTFGLSHGWLEETGRQLRLTAEGLLFADEIFLRLF